MLSRIHFAFLILVFLPDSLTADEAKASWQRLVNSRQEIRSAHIRLAHKILVFDGQSNHELCNREMLFKIWFDGPLCRYDVSTLDSRTGKEFDLKENLSFRRAMTADKILNCLSCDAISIAADESTANAIRLFPPTALGCVEGGLSPVMEEDNSILLSFPTMFGGFPEVLQVENGLQAKAATGVMRVQLDLLSELPNLIEVNMQEGAYHTLTRTQWEPSRSDKAVSWFPKQVDYQRFHFGKLQEHSITQVEIAELNSMVDPKLFTWEGMMLPEGKLISRSPTENDVVEFINGKFKKKIWAESEKVTALRSPNSGKLIAVLVGGLALVALFLVRRLRFVSYQKGW